MNEPQNVTFEEERAIGSARYSGNNQNSFSIGKLLVKWGIVRDESQAQIILLGIAIVSIAISIWLATHIISFGTHLNGTDRIKFPNGTSITVDKYVEGIKNGTYK